MKTKVKKTRQLATMSEATDPWSGIRTPSQTFNFTGKRVDSKLRWDLFWAVDINRNCLLILEFNKINSPKNRLPQLRGLKVEIIKLDDSNKRSLVIRLIDNDQYQIFYRLCRDLISATQIAKSEAEAVERLLIRTWRWHRLLRGGKDGRLSKPEQMGLLGELSVIQHILFPTIGISAAIKSWTGPLLSPKDFEIRRICIEAKARRSATTPYVTIPSEHQLDTDGVDALFLHVSEITTAADNDDNAITVTESAQQIKNITEIQDILSTEIFEERLSAVGFDWNDDYSDAKWLLGPIHLFEIDEDFPRISRSMIPAGVCSVHYSIALHDCEKFRTDVDSLKAVLTA